MKKIFLWSVLSAVICTTAFSQNKVVEDPVVMTIAGKDIPLSEFLFIAEKDSTIDLLNKESLKNYVELFKTFKLKVADAEAVGIDKSKAFQNEFANYEAQLRASFLSDKVGESVAIHDVYNKSKNILSASLITFLLPSETVSKDTVAVYQQAKKVYDRIRSGEDFDKVSKELTEGEHKDSIFFDQAEYIYPLQMKKAIENTVYQMNVGDISAPVRSEAGFHIIRLNKKIPNPGIRQVAHILIGSTSSTGELPDTTLLSKANDIYEKAKNGEDFNELVRQYSIDTKTNAQGGLLPFFGLGKMIKPFEEAAFALKEINDISKPVKSRYGYHIIRLIDRKPQAPYEEVESSYYAKMRQGDRNFELFYTYDEREKKKLGYKLNQEAYDELQRLCDDYFPTDTAFYNRASKMKKVLMHMNNKDFLQDEFAEYIRSNPFSTKTYSGDFMSEVYRLFVRDIINIFERKALDSNPEYKKLLKEYHDGILLFEISNERVWSKPIEEQAKLEKEWIKELNHKYEVHENRKVLDHLNKYIPASKK